MQALIKSIFKSRRDRSQPESTRQNASSRRNSQSVSSVDRRYSSTPIDIAGFHPSPLLLPEVRPSQPQDSNTIHGPSKRPGAPVDTRRYGVRPVSLVGFNPPPLLLPDDPIRPQPRPRSSHLNAIAGPSNITETRTSSVFVPAPVPGPPPMLFPELHSSLPASPASKSIGPVLAPLPECETSLCLEQPSYSQASSSAPRPETKNPPPPLEPETGDLQCFICYSDPTMVEFPPRSPTSACSHPPNMCTDCLRNFLLQATESANLVTAIQCPAAGCSQVLEHADVQTWAAPSVFVRYDRRLLRESLPTNGNYLSCVNASCHGIQEHMRDNNVIVTCHLCNTRQCAHHRVPWHDGFTCAQWDQRQRTQEITLSEEWIQRETKACPGCGVRIQRDGGCATVTCRRPAGCGHEFCWACFAPSQEILRADNSRHYDNCPYYSGLPGGNPAPAECSSLFTSISAPSELVATTPIQELSRSAPNPIQEPSPPLQVLDVDCVVCSNGSSEVDFPPTAPTSACSHPAELCVSCLQRVILTAVENGSCIAGIRCPSIGCSQTLEYDDIRKWAPEGVFKRYDKDLLKNALNTSADYVYCLNAGCDAGQEHTTGELGYVLTCHSCGSRQCIRHKVLWHEGFTCTQWDEHKRVLEDHDQQSKNWIKKKTIPCPRCKIPLIKAGGCDHYTCKRAAGGCGHEFCWICFVNWTGSYTTRHYDHCSLYEGSSGGNPAPYDVASPRATTVAMHQLAPVYARRAYRPPGGHPRF